jgi:hypothetical protein
MSWWIRNPKKGTITSFSISGIYLIVVFVLPVLALIVLSRLACRIGSERLAPMYRTEANLTAIESAIRAYSDRYDALPPSGRKGLQLAIDELNREVTFFPEGVPRDGWGRTYVYVNSDDYGSEDSMAIKDAASELYHNPGRYQLYSPGQDGKRSAEDGPMAGDRLNEDNIDNWDAKQSWRNVYKSRARADVRDTNEE